MGFEISKPPCWAYGKFKKIKNIKYRKNKKKKTLTLFLLFLTMIKAYSNKPPCNLEWTAFENSTDIVKLYIKLIFGYK